MCVQKVWAWSWRLDRSARQITSSTSHSATSWRVSVTTLRLISVSWSALCSLCVVVVSRLSHCPMFFISLVTRPCLWTASLFIVSVVVEGRSQSQTQITSAAIVHHIRPHWLNATLVYQRLNSLAPSYLADDCQLVSDVLRRRLRSSDSVTCAVRRTWTTYGDRCFAVAGPRVWNSLPTELRQSDRLGQFKRRLKTHLFGLWNHSA